MNQLSYLFTPRKILRHLFVLAIVGACVWAGLWQMERLHSQNAFAARVTARLHATPVPLGRLIPPGTSARVDAVTYRRVVATGTFDPANEVVLLARTLQDVNGNHVLTPLVLSDGTAIMVDRGWVPFDQLQPPIADAAPPRGPAAVSGVLFPPQLSTRGASEPAARDLTKVDLARLQRQVPYRIAPVYIWLRALSPPQSGELPTITPLPDVTVGPPHLSYTVQWFLFALIGLVGYPIVIRREMRRRRTLPKEAGGLDAPDGYDEGPIGAASSASSRGPMNTR